MTDAKPSKNPVFVDLCTRFDFDEPRAAEYLGVPVFTFRKWLNGERTPNASALRLLEVLGMVEVMAPAIHSSFLPEPKKPNKNVHVGKVPSNP
jgi:hypothetical protein